MPGALYNSTGWTFNAITFAENIDLTKVEKITNIVDFALLPKALGGHKVSTSKGKADDLYCRGVVHLPIGEYYAGLAKGNATSSSSGITERPSRPARKMLNNLLADVVDSEGRSAFEMVQSIEPSTDKSAAPTSLTSMEKPKVRPNRKLVNKLLSNVVDSEGRGAFEMIESI